MINASVHPAASRNAACRACAACIDSLRGVNIGFMARGIGRKAARWQGKIRLNG
jgi:hypothetical protein